MKKLLYWLMAVVLATTSLACSASCGGGNSASEKEQESETTSETVSETIPGGDSSSSSGDDNVTYVDVPSAPVYAEIDYGGYTTYYFDSVPATTETTERAKPPLKRRLPRQKRRWTGRQRACVFFSRAALCSKGV